MPDREFLLVEAGALRTGDHISGLGVVSRVDRGPGDVAIWNTSDPFFGWPLVLSATTQVWVSPRHDRP